MSSRQFHHIVQAFVSQLEKLAASEKSLRQQLHWLLRSQMVSSQTRNSEAGFVLPTVVMVTLVVVLLTTALVLRSFDRSRNARNFRVNETVLNAATPALDRARAKIDALFEDPTLPRATPSELSLYNAFQSNNYTLPGEVRLTLADNFNTTAGIQASANLADNELTNTAWAFDVDTNNDGVNDSTTIYSIVFRTPLRDSSGKLLRARSPLDARTPPMEDGLASGRCAAALSTVANLVGGSDWYKAGDVLKKSFYIYSATIPKTPGVGQGFSALEVQQDRVRIPISNNAVWYEDDFEVADPADNLRLNGRVFTNANLLVRGRSDQDRKLQFYQVSGDDSCYYQEENSKIVVAGNVANGDVTNTDSATLTASNGRVEVHRFQGPRTNPDTSVLNAANTTTTESGGSNVGYNNNAYDQRIELMVVAAKNLHGTATPTTTSVNGVSRYPQQVKDGFGTRVGADTKPPSTILEEELRRYFRERTRRVPYKEVAAGGSGIIKTAGTPNTLYSADSASANFVFGSGTGAIQPPDAWMSIASADTSLSLKFDGSGANLVMNLPATEPKKQAAAGQEANLGDRIKVGNGLPAIWYKATAPAGFQQKGASQPVVDGSGNTVYWNQINGTADGLQRQRQSQIATLPDLGSTERDGYWEGKAAYNPKTGESSGGLRIITGAGLYLKADGTISTDTVVWPDSAFVPDTGAKPVANATAGPSNNTHIIDNPADRANGNNNDKPYLRMRATAVYHYKTIGSAAGETDPNQLPIACVSSYLDPTDSNSKSNLNALPWNNTTTGKSNNGIVYPQPYSSHANRLAAVVTNIPTLKNQATLTFPASNRLVNPALKAAMDKFSDTGSFSTSAEPLTLEENSAIDTALCALKILKDTTYQPSETPVSGVTLPHGAIKESAFLDARQLRTLHALDGSNGLRIPTLANLQSDAANLYNQYTLPIEQRQPLEVRVTDIDLGELAAQTVGTGTGTGALNNQEYLLPNSGIIYATRNDALTDESTLGADSKPNPILSATDFKLDPSRRPNGIRLLNGTDLARTDTYRIAEKGLILATNLPVYIKAATDPDGSGLKGFNLHKTPGGSSVPDDIRAEFTDYKMLQESDWSFANFYGRSRNNLDQNFACREDQPSCAGDGDQWRPATIISDAITLLSDTFNDGDRSKGDYDLNEHLGDGTSATKRLKEGFWLNNFVTSTQWWTTTTGIPYPATRDTYLTNGVTPVQRRADFPEYVMEICRKLPVSECRQQDWVITINNAGTPQDIKSSSAALVNKPVADLLSGTTVRPATNAADRRYPRRIAFKRNNYGALAFTALSNGKATAIPFGIDLNNVVKEAAYPQDSTQQTAFATNFPARPNALWFWTTNSTTGVFVNASNQPDPAYSSDRPLYYVPPEVGGTKLILPDTQCFSFNTATGAPGGIVPCGTTYQAGVVNLNLPATPTGQKASDYVLCLSASGTQSGVSKDFQIDSGDITATSCPTDTATAIDQVIGSGVNSGLEDMTANVTPAVFTTTGTGANRIIQDFTLNAAGPVNVYEFSSVKNFRDGGVLRLSANGQIDPVFVLKVPSGFKFGVNENAAGVTLELDGVHPNNIFWVADGLEFSNAAAATPHILAGNFLGKNAAPGLGNNVKIDGGRFLGYTQAPRFPTNTTVTAVTADGQPLVVPMLQIHNPEGAPQTTYSTTLNNDTVFTGAIGTRWLQSLAASAKLYYNLAFVAGHTPSRPTEGNGGFPNFPRFLENWNPEADNSTRATALISGGFIQDRTSKYASAAFTHVDATRTDGSLFYRLTQNSNTEPFYLNKNGSATNKTGFRYPGGAGRGLIPFYQPPGRLWGFDVALLTQAPDAFSERFTVPPTTPPSEFFREVGRDDPWVQSLLCAVTTTATSNGSAFTADSTTYNYYLPASQRPGCNF